MIIIPKDQIDQMAPVMDTILKYPTLTVGQIKKKFNLNKEEYEMIMDLTMPLLREANIKKYWATKYKHIEHKIAAYLKKDNIDDAKFKKFISELIFEHGEGEEDMIEATGLNGGAFFNA